MTAELEPLVEPLRLTPGQRDKWLQLITDQPHISSRGALWKAGVKIVARPPEGKRKAQYRAATKAEVEQLLASDPDLHEAYEDARGRSPERIRAELQRRAIDGVLEPVFHQGEIVGEIRRYSDRLLLALAKARLPEFQDTTRIEVTGGGGGPIEIEDHSASLTDVARVLYNVGALTVIDGELIAEEDEDDADVSGGAARAALPAAPHLLPDPAAG